jgi:hypothetical protein
MSDVKDARDRPAVEPAWDQDRPPWDEANPPGTSGLFAGTSGDGWIYAAVAAVAVAVGFVGALSTADDIVRRGGVYDLRTPLLWDMTSVAVIIALSPVLLVAVRHIRRQPSWPVVIGLSIAAIIAFSAVHITGMVWLRKLIVWLAGGEYDFRFSLATVLYEFRKDVTTCVLIGGGLWLMDSRREAQRALKVVAPEAVGTSPAPPAVVWLRDGAKSIRVAPRDIVWIASAGNYVEYTLADGASHLIRGTLAAAESELARFNLARIHRTRLANLDRVTGLENKPSGDFELTFDTGQTVSGSRRYRDAVAALERAANAM